MRVTPAFSWFTRLWCLLYECAIAAITKWHKVSGRWQHGLITSQLCSSEVQQGSAGSSAQEEPKWPCGPVWAFLWMLWGRMAWRFIEVFGRIQFPGVLALGSQLPHWLSTRAVLNPQKLPEFFITLSPPSLHQPQHTVSLLGVNSPGIPLLPHELLFWPAKFPALNGSVIPLAVPW